MAPSNVLVPNFDTESHREGFTYRRARIGRQAGSQRLGASIYEIPPGQATFPYHAHLANEEMLVVLSGRPSLRTPQGWRELDVGEVVAFPVGERGAHQVVNHGEGTVRVLVLSEMNAPDVTLYPEEDKVGALQRAPGAPGEGGQWYFRRAEAEVDYWEGVEPPKRRR